MSEHEVRLVRELPYPREVVFEAWTQPQHLTGWMGPSAEIQACDVKVDLRPDGAYQIGFIEAGQRMTVRGHYRTIDPPSCLVFTWVWDEPQQDAGAVTLVTLNLEETEVGTRLHVLHQKFASESGCELHRHGWAGTLEKMSRYLEEHDICGLSP